MNINLGDGDGGDVGQKNRMGRDESGKGEEISADIEFEGSTSIAVSPRGPCRPYN